MERLEFEKSIDFGDILSSITIFVSALGLFLSIDANTKIQSQRLEEERRDAASQVIVASDQWVEADRSINERLQPVFVEASRIVAIENNPSLARDYFYKSVNEIKIQIASEIVEKEISTAYQKVMIYDSSSRSRYRKMVGLMRDNEFRLFRYILDQGQNILLKENLSDPRSEVEIGNELRNMSLSAIKNFVDSSNSKVRTERVHFCRMVYDQADIASDCATIS